MKYLQQRKGIWYIRVRRPPKSWGLSGEFIHTLRTPHLNEARKIRDKYLTPILAETKGVEMVESILKLLAGANEGIKEKLQRFGEILGDEDTELTVLDVFKKFIKYRERTGQKRSTIQSYMACMSSIERLIPNMFINELTTKHIIKWRDELLELPPSWMGMAEIDYSKGTMSTTTINNQLSKFRTVWDWAQSEKLVLGKLKNPAIGINAGKSSKVRTNKPITVDECDRLLEMKLSKRIKSIDAKSWKYIPVIARYTGARLAEIAQLTTNDIRTVQGVLCVEITNHDGKTTKNEQSVRTVPISDKLKKMIEPLMFECESAVDKKDLFIKRGDYGGRAGKYFSQEWNRQAKRVGEHCYFHGLRAYTITQMANAGIPEMDRMKIVGHVNKTSHSGYTKDDLSRFKRALDTVI